MYSSNFDGEGEYKSSSITENQDLYMSIHSFYYKKSANNTAIVLTDRYDFDFKTSYDDFVTQAAVNMMAKAQEQGFLTPYYVIVEAENKTYITNNAYNETFNTTNWRYNEAGTTLGKGESITYDLVFNTSGYRNIQTFGYNDTYLTLRSSSGSLLISNDDGGYNRNAFLKYYFNAGEKYKIVLRFYSSSTMGNVRTAITPSTNSSFDDISSITRTWSLFKTYYKNTEVNNGAGNVAMYTLQPATSSSYTIETTKKGSYVDTYLMLIDPRRADDDRYVPKAEKLKSSIYNDDGGGNLQAKISIGSHATDIPYLIIASTYSYSVSGNFYIKISGMDTSHIIIL